MIPPKSFRHSANYDSCTKPTGTYGIMIGDLTLWNPHEDGDPIGIILTTPDENGVVVVYSAGRTLHVNWSQVRPIYRIDGTKIDAD